MNLLNQFNMFVLDSSRYQQVNQKDLQRHNNTQVIDLYKLRHGRDSLFS